MSYAALLTQAHIDKLRYHKISLVAITEPIHPAEKSFITKWCQPKWSRLIEELTPEQQDVCRQIRQSLIIKKQYQRQVIRRKAHIDKLKTQIDEITRAREKAEDDNILLRQEKELWTGSIIEACQIINTAIPTAYIEPDFQNNQLRLNDLPYLAERDLKTPLNITDSASCDSPTQDTDQCLSPYLRPTTYEEMLAI